MTMFEKDSNPYPCFDLFDSLLQAAPNHLFLALRIWNHRFPSDVWKSVMIR